MKQPPVFLDKNDSRAIAPLFEALKNSDSSVRAEAEKALNRITEDNYGIGRYGFLATIL